MNHRACRECFSVLVPGNVPRRQLNDQAGKCCWCGKSSASGIYMRADKTDCLDNHEEDGSAKYILA